MIRVLAVLAIHGAIMAVVAPDARTPAAPTAAPPPAAPVTAATTAPPQLNGIGQTVSNGGITLVVKAVHTANTIDMNESNYRPGSGYETYTKTKAGDGAKYVVVETHV